MEIDLSFTLVLAIFFASFLFSFFIFSFLIANRSADTIIEESFSEINGTELRKLEN